MKRTIGLMIVLLLFLSGILFGESVWEGTASMGRYGEFPASGLYGASSSFPRNTVVEVEHIRTGRKVTVIIVDRLDDSELFILLSREACEKIGISQEEVVPVRVKVSLRDSGGYSRLYGDRPYNPDPDINPAAGFEDLKSFLFDDVAMEAAEPVEVVEPIDEIAAQEAAEPVEAVEAIDEIAAEEPLSEEPETLEIAEEEVPVLEEEPILQQIVIDEPEETSVEEPIEEPAAEPVETPVMPEEPFTLEPRIVIDEEEPVEEEIVDVLQSPGLEIESTIAEFEPPAEETEEAPRVSDLLESPEEVSEVVLADLDVPEEIVEEISEEVHTPETPIVHNGSLESPEEQTAVEFDSVDEPAEMVDFVAASPEEPETAVPEIPVEEVVEKEEDPSFYEEEIASFIPLPGNAELVLEPAEPRPPKDMIPDAVNGIPYAPDTGEDVVALTLDDLNIPEYEELEESVAEEATAEEISAEEVIIEETVSEEILVETIEEIVPDKVAVAVNGEEEIPAISEEPIEEPADESIEEPLPEILISETEAEVALLEPVEEKIPAFREEPVVRLESEAYYLQLGAFSKSTSASRMAETFSPVYPVTVQETMINSSKVYKVLIGPLNTDESGSLLYTLKAKGYKDAFLRRGE